MLHHRVTSQWLASIMYFSCVWTTAIFRWHGETQSDDPAMAPRGLGFGCGVLEELRGGQGWCLVHGHRTLLQRGDEERPLGRSLGFVWIHDHMRSFLFLDFMTAFIHRVQMLVIQPNVTNKCKQMQMSHVLNPGSHVIKGGPCKDLRRKQNTGRRKPA